MRKITIYSTPTCGYCHMIKDYLDQNNVPYDEVIVNTKEKQSELLAISNQLSVPVTTIGDVVIIGFDVNRINQELNI